LGRIPFGVDLNTPHIWWTEFVETNRRHGESFC
jgi:hypothetical protein